MDLLIGNKCNLKNNNSSNFPSSYGSKKSDQ
jgi:hypothetical protein